MLTLWPMEERHRSDVDALFCSSGLCFLHLDRVWHHAARAAEDDDSLRSTLLRSVRRRRHRGKLDHVGHQALA